MRLADLGAVWQLILRPELALGELYMDGRIVVTQEPAQGAAPRTIDACEVGRAALLLASDYTTAITGEFLYVDGDINIKGMVFH